MPSGKPRRPSAKRGIVGRSHDRARKPHTPSSARSPLRRHRGHRHLRRRMRVDRLLLRPLLPDDRRAPSRRARSRAAARVREAARDSPQRRAVAARGDRSAERSGLRAADAGAESGRVRRRRAELSVIPRAGTHTGKRVLISFQRPQPRRQARPQAVSALSPRVEAHSRSTRSRSLASRWTRPC